MNDEIMQEVHAIKDALAKKYGHDLNALLVNLTENEAKLASAGFRIVPAPVSGVQLAGSALQRSRLVRR